MTGTELLQCSAKETVTADHTLVDIRDQRQETNIDGALHRPDDMHHPMIAIGRRETNMVHERATKTQEITILDQLEMNPGATTTTGAIDHGLRMPVDVDMWTETAKATNHLYTTAGV
ncbi:hypothetical protein Q9189_003503 [Teloschistes chrysophthalmus]